MGHGCQPGCCKISSQLGQEPDNTRPLPLLWAWKAFLFQQWSQIREEAISNPVNGKDGKRSCSHVLFSVGKGQMRAETCRPPRASELAVDGRFALMTPEISKEVLKSLALKRRAHLTI